LKRYSVGYPQREQEFICVHCQQLVTCNPIVAGVQNRNHCPCCLWSRHLDWRTPGDRLSPCRQAMEPVGLTTKRGKNKYGGERNGELMLIHRCGCGAVVINRIAADDHQRSLIECFERSWHTSPIIMHELMTMGISLLTRQEQGLVEARLFGN
jgi:hypothetical protein